MAAYGSTRVFGSRAAWLQTGAMLGSIMAANVWRVIVPGQTKMLAQTRAGVPADTAPGTRQARSIHNHYLDTTRTVHDAVAALPQRLWAPVGWLVLLLMFAFGVALKYVMNFRTRSDWRMVIAGRAARWCRHRADRSAWRRRQRVRLDAARCSADEQAFAIVERRCTTCHSEKPSNPSFPEPRPA